MSDYLFVTGKLAADALKSTLKSMEPDFNYELAVLNISVAALMDTCWIARQLARSGFREFRQVMIPGLCRGNLSVIQEAANVPVIRGPKDLKDLPIFFGHEKSLEGYGRYHVKIIAEIVDAYSLSWKEILKKAEYYRASGADIIDLGCPPRGTFKGVEKVVVRLKKRGYTVSLDTFDPATILQADRAGLDLLLSINSQNINLTKKLHCNVVVIPDFDDKSLKSLERNAAQLERWGIPYIMDPILDPLCIGFMAALDRFSRTRRRHPDAKILMGVGNLTELTDADSTGINALMAGLITELGIDYVLTTEVISWARGAVRELDHARKLMYYAFQNRMVPKNLNESLITVKDPPYQPYTEKELRHMQRRLHDKNFRIFTDDKWIYIFNRNAFIRSKDPAEIFAKLGPIDSEHAFYLGRELERAALAVRLGKKYVQEVGLRWGYLTNQ